MNERKSKSFDLVIMSVFIAIIIIQAIVPMLGYIPLGFMNATIIQVTVAIGAILLGARKGAFIGLVFGLTSLWKNTFMPNPTSFVFSPFVESLGGYHGDIRSLIICLVPRILVGVVAALVFLYFNKIKKRKLALVLAGALSSMTNTILVMGSIYLLFGNDYASATNKAFTSLPQIIIYIIGTQGVLEAIVSAILCFGIGSVLLKVLDK
jgi:hypothetical protein